MPPSRYRVVERGRRLVVIDTRTGAPATTMVREEQPRFDEVQRRVVYPSEDSAPPRSDPRAALEALRGARPEPRRPAPARLNAGEGGILATQSWFDNKAPRMVRLGPNGQKPFGLVVGVLFAIGMTLFFLLGWPALLVIGFLVVQGRKPMRAAITGWLDAQEQVRD